MPQSTGVKLRIGCLTLGEELAVHNAANAKKDDHALGCASDLSRLLWSWRT